jgi:AcrR family transcriptional regulator
MKSRREQSERSRSRILAVSLELFRKRGFDRTTMRDIAKAAGTSLGAAYYYFPSKEAIVLSYYEELVESFEARAREVFERTPDLRERLRGVFHAKLDLARRDRKLMAALSRTVGDSQSAVSVFAARTRPIRERTIGVMRQAVSVPEVPETLRELSALGLWTLLLAVLIYFIHDGSPKQERTRRLVDHAIELLLPLVPLFSMPEIFSFREQLAALLEDAGLVETPAPKSD